jgi:integrase
VKPVAQVAYLTGWRKGELLSRRWRHVDLEEGWLRLEPGETKNGRGRMFPLIPQLRTVLERQYKRKLEIERRNGRLVNALFFHDDGRPIRSFRRSWHRACEEAGHPDMLFHDLRRTAARNLVRAGVPALQAKDFTGHLTLSVFDRYAIFDEVTMQEAGAKYADQLARAAADRKVLPLHEEAQTRHSQGGSPT